MLEKYYISVVYLKSCSVIWYVENLPSKKLIKKKQKAKGLKRKNALLLLIKQASSLFPLSFPF